MARMVNEDKISLMKYFKISKRTAELWKVKFNDLDFIYSFDYTDLEGETLDDFYKRIYLVVGLCPEIRDLTLGIKNVTFDYYLLKSIVVYFLEYIPNWLSLYHDRWLMKKLS